MYNPYSHQSPIHPPSKPKTQSIPVDIQQFQTRKHSRSFKQQRSHTITSIPDDKDRRYSAYKTPTNTKYKNKMYNTISDKKQNIMKWSCANWNTNEKSKSKGKERGKSANFRKIIGSPFSKIKVKNIIESGLFVKDITDVETKVKPPSGFKLLKGIGVDPEKSLIFAAEKVSQKLIVYIQLNPTKHLLKFYKHFFNEDKIKRAYLKNSYIRLILAPKIINPNYLCYSFEGEWCLETELQSFVDNQNCLEITDNTLGNYLKTDPKSIKKIIVDLCKMLTLLEEHHIIHGNLKKSFILSTFNSRNIVKSIKIFGFDKWMYFKQFQQKLDSFIHLSTPPQVLNFICFQRQLKFDRGMLNFMETYKESKSWLFDMWSVGIILLELVLGFPLFLSAESAILNGIQFEPVFKQFTGLNETIQKQMDIIFSLDNILKEKNTCVSVDLEIKYLLKMMLNVNPSKRLSPKEVIHYLS